MSAAPIGPNGKGSILPGIDGAQEKFPPPFVQACGIGPMISAVGDQLNRMMPPSIVKMADLPAVALLGKGPPSVLKNKSHQR